MIDPVTRLHLVRIVVAVDPAVTSGEDADDTGIIVAALGRDGDGYVLDDRTCHLSPEGWARRVVAAYDRWGADRVIAEANNGGELVSTVLRAIRANLPVKLVHASRGKLTRAEPVAALYEQARVHHVGGFPELEDQLCSWVPGEERSPDRLDALVWALTELMVDGVMPGAPIMTRKTPHAAGLSPARDRGPASVEHPAQPWLDQAGESAGKQPAPARLVTRRPSPNRIR